MQPPTKSWNFCGCSNRSSKRCNSSCKSDQDNTQQALLTLLHNHSLGKQNRAAQLDVSCVPHRPYAAAVIITTLRSHKRWVW
jgi:hypothetical protein